MTKPLAFEEARERAETLLIDRPLKKAEKWFGISLLDKGIPILDPRYIEIDGNYMFFVNEEFGLEESKRGCAERRYGIGTYNVPDGTKQAGRRS